MRTMIYCRDLARGLLMLAIVAGLHPSKGVIPIDFGPESTLAPRGEQYEPREVSYFVQRPHQLLGIMVTALVVLISTGAKTGGGALLYSVNILVLKLPPDEAISLASVTIFGGAICDFLLNLWKKSMNTNSSLINWDFVLVMQPMLLMGAAFGASIISWFSAGLFSIALIVYLVYISLKTLKKAQIVGYEEGWRCFRNQNSETISLLGTSSRNFESNDVSFQCKGGLPWRKLGINLGLLTATAFLTSLQGGKHFRSPLGIPQTSFFSFIVSMLPFIFLSVVSHYQMKGAVATYQRQQIPGFILLPNEVQWSPDSIKRLPLHLLGIGAISGAFGVSSEEATSVLLRQVNFAPVVVSAMSATTVFFVSGMASFDFFLWGKLNLDLAKFLVPLGFLMTFLGRICLMKIACNAKSRTLLLFALTASMFISIVTFAFVELRSVFIF